MKTASPKLFTLGGLFLLSAATLAFEINLTRLFSVSQFYHFAFLIVSIALLGFGASGTTLAIFPNVGRGNPARSVSILALLSGFSMVGAYILTNQVPFDSFSIAWDRTQIGILIIHYAALAIPFYFSGMAIGLLLSTFPETAGKIYAFNLTGAAVGCLIALVAPANLGGEGTVILSCGIAILASTISALGQKSFTYRKYIKFPGIIYFLLVLSTLIFLTIDIDSRIRGKNKFRWLDLYISPYKSLSYALQYPNAETTYQEWNSFSRVDKVRSEGIRSLPGLSFKYLDQLPAEDAIFIDGDNLNPVVKSNENQDFVDFLPTVLPFIIRPDADTLILSPQGGLDVLVALESGAGRINVVEPNSLILNTVEDTYNDARIQINLQSDRSYLRSSPKSFDVIIISLKSSYHPIRSGAYSLYEDYRYTVEGFQDALEQLNPDGILMVTRWLQDPPSESLRAFTTAVTALENLGVQAEESITVIRGYNTSTLFIKRTGFNEDELAQIRDFASSRAFDIVYAPDLEPEEVNRFSVLQEPVYSTVFSQMLNANPRSEFYQYYEYDVTPPTDNRPFFGQYFKWSQTRQVLGEFGKTWQPFGGAGYFVLIALLFLSFLMAIVLIILPLVIAQLRTKYGTNPSNTVVGISFNSPQTDSKKIYVFLIFFGFIGLAYLFVEIPLIQSFILYMTHPAYALTTVLFSLLLFSGIGSYFSPKIPLIPNLIALVILILFQPILNFKVFEFALGLPIAYRLVVAVVTLAPVGFLMGVPFPSGMRTLGEKAKDVRFVPWAWAINGSASVIASIFAVILALTAGFGWVFTLGAICYFGALITALGTFYSPRRKPQFR